MLTMWPEEDAGGDMASQCLLSFTPGEYALVTKEGYGSEQTEGYEVWVADNGASESVTPSTECMLDFVECDTYMVNVNGTKFPPKGQNKILMMFQTREVEYIDVTLTDVVAYVPSLGFNLLSLNSVADNGHEYVRRKGGITVYLAGGGEIYFPPRSRLRAVHGYRFDKSRMPVHASTVIYPGLLPKANRLNINTYHNMHAHSNDVILRETAKRHILILEGELQPCEGCAKGKGLKKVIRTSTMKRLSI